MKYDAFISYRHSDLDMFIAKKIHKGLETFKVPKAVAKKTGKKNIKRVFRDQEELPIGSDLGDNIQSALAESEYLLVICSPRTPESYWVQKEITTFIEMHGREHVLAILIEGEPNESFPEQLLMDDEGNPVEPLAADVRGASKREINKKMKTEIMRLAAPLLHCSYDDLRQRHKERRMKRIAAVTATVSATVAALAISFGAYNAYNAAIIQENYEGKQRNQSKYLADTSLQLLEEGDRRAAVLVALEALPSEENERPYVAEAQYALSQALYAYDAGNAMQMERVLSHDLPVDEFYFNEAGTRVVSMDQGANIYVWDVESGEKLAQIAPGITEYGYIEIPEAVFIYEDNIIICVEDKLCAVTFEGQEEWCVNVPEGITFCSFDESAKMAACVNGEMVTFFDISTGEKAATLVNQQELSFTNEMAFSEDKTKFAIAHSAFVEDVEYGLVTVYEFATGQNNSVETMLTDITDIEFTEDDCLVVTQYNYEDMMESEGNIAAGCIQKFDYKSGELLWQDSYEFQWVGNESASTQLKCRKYQDAATGEIHNEVMMSVDNFAYTWDNVTGECIAKVQVDSGIATLLVASNSKFGFLGQFDGTVDIVDMTTGTRYSASAIETGKEMRRMLIRNGILMFRSYASPNLTVMKYPDYADALELESYDDTIDEVHYSKEGTYYAVKPYVFGESDKIYFYRTEDHSLVREWTVEEESMVADCSFIGDDVFVVLDSGGRLVFYEVESGEKEELDWDEDSHFVDYAVNEGCTFAIAYCGDEYRIIDLLKREIIAAERIENNFLGAVLSEDGSRIYCSVKDLGVCIIDVASGALTPIELPGYQVLSGSGIQNAFEVSRDGSMLAVSCIDGMLRVLNVNEMETVAEIPFTSVYRCLIKFTDEDTKLMMQGDDYYFRVYDLEQDEFSYIATDQYYDIEEVVVDEKSETISLITFVDMIILNAEDFERSAQIEGGKAYLPGQGQILADENGTLYRFHYMTLEMLQEEARKQFGNDTLTELERIKYNVE
uniref:TIR domain-containing protein n=1 Tax=Acetatifactor sp. TaxID=1872090 RepID=UPI004057286C